MIKGNFYQVVFFLFEGGLLLITYRKTITPPQASIFMTIFHSIGTVAVYIVLRSLDGPNQIDFFHPTGGYTHILCYFFDIVKVHDIPPDIIKL